MSDRKKSDQNPGEMMGGLSLFLACVCLIIWAFGPDRFGIAAAIFGAAGVVLLGIGAAARRTQSRAQ